MLEDVILLPKHTQPERLRLEVPARASAELASWEALAAEGSWSVPEWGEDAPGSQWAWLPPRGTGTGLTSSIICFYF